MFYILYPDLRSVIANYLFERYGGETVESSPITFLPPQIQQSLIAELQDEGKQQSLTAKSARAQESLIVTGISPDGFAMSLSDGSVKTVPQALFDRLSKRWWNILPHSQTPNCLSPDTSYSYQAKRRFGNS